MMTAFPITPETYRLTLAPDLDRFVFDGHLVLTATAHEPATTLRLDCVGLDIRACDILAAGTDAAPKPCEFTLEPAAEALIIVLPEPVSGRFSLTLSWSGPISDTMAGFYRSRIQVPGAPSHMAVTQFQESDARRAFPCFDHPAQKAVFELSMIVPRALTAISNTDVRSITDIPDEKKQVVFHPTPRMSTYLFFFGVGPFEIHTDLVDSRMRAICLPGMGDQTRFGLTFGRKALAYGETYYDIAYPLSKMDLIAVPDFAFGAMENWGAITFRENLLLQIDGITSREGEGRICEVIAHEIAHQWFGNLVTPEDWKYLWLNESFATYFGYGMVDDAHPDWDFWSQFVRSQTESAMARDSLHETVPIEMPGGALVAITSSTAPIIYNKGGSVVRQLEAWVGPDRFRAGLRRYLSDHAYGCTASRHVWEALAETAAMPVDQLMESWVTQPGFPLVTVRRDQNTLHFDQKRFTFLPGDTDQTWMIPLTLALYGHDGAVSFHTRIMADRSDRFDLPAGTLAYKINPEQTGFYHVKYEDPDNFHELVQRVKNHTLSAMDRWGIQNDAYALVKSGDLSMTDYLSLAAAFRGETDYLPLSSLVAHLFEAALILEGDIRAQTVRTAAGLIHDALAGVGWTPLSLEPPTTAMLRDQLLVHGALLGDADILAELMARFRGFLEGAAIAPDIFRAVMTAGAVSGDSKAVDAMMRCYEKSQVEHERMTLVTALGSAGPWPVLEKALDYALDTVPDRIRYLPIVAAAGNPGMGRMLWHWLESRLPRIKTMHPMLFERVIATFVPGGPGLSDPDQTRRFCAALLGDHPRLADVIALSLERLTANVAFRQRER
ncbi:M1 family metallopeptidase [Desulfosarcina sp. OttesenSCG-928-G10]|nr:M1 family metallopeptidase [Desulfosarcina sp. OttesenSCG-928-G10]